MYETMTEAEFRKSAGSGFRGQPRIFLFYGEEDYLKANAVNVARDALIAPDAAAFDFVSLGAAAVSAGAVAAALAAPPMFGENKLVALSFSPDGMKPSELGDILDTLEGLGPGDPNTVIMNVPDGGLDPGYPKRPSALLKRIAEFARPVLFDRVPQNRLAAWAERHYRANGVSAAPEVCSFTVGYCGSDMYRLASEIDKISFYVLSRGASRVGEDDVRVAGCPTSGFDAFALSNAMIAGRHRQALEVLAFMRSQKAEPVRVMADIIRVICDMKAVSACTASGMTGQQISEATGIKPYPLGRYLKALETADAAAVNRALELARAADEGVKGYGDGYVAIERLICSM
jgi:DNA polymerase-3 subunit delta